MLELDFQFDSNFCFQRSVGGRNCFSSSSDGWEQKFSEASICRADEQTSSSSSCSTFFSAVNYFGQYLIKSISPMMMGSLLCCFMNNSISLLASQYKLHSNIRKKILFLHWETNMIPGQISSLPKPKDRRIGSCCLFEAKVYVALTFEVLLVGFEI